MPETTIDDVMKAYAVDAVSAAARRKVALDYSEQSLDAVDDLLSRESFVGRTPRTPESPEDEATLWALSKAFGGYVGEVVLRVLGGRWMAESTPGGGTRPAVEVRGVKGFPVEKVWKRLTESEFASVGGYCRVLRAIMEKRAADEAAASMDEGRRDEQ
jgi:hypothetical protein